MARNGRVGGMWRWSPAGAWALCCAALVGDVLAASPRVVVPALRPARQAAATTEIAVQPVEPLPAVMLSPAAWPVAALVNQPSDTATEAEVELADPTVKPMTAMSLNIAPPTGELPRDVAKPRFEREPTFYDVERVGRPEMAYNYSWVAPALCYSPLYFEQPNVERYGYTLGVLQPFASAAHFFATIPLLPYKMTLDPPCECQYPLGYYRPGSCGPLVCQKPRLRPLPAVVEGAAVTGLIFLIP